MNEFSFNKNMQFKKDQIKMVQEMILKVTELQNYWCHLLECVCVCVCVCVCAHVRAPKETRKGHAIRSPELQLQIFVSWYGGSQNGTQVFHERADCCKPPHPLSTSRFCLCVWLVGFVVCFYFCFCKEPLSCSP